MRNEDKKGKGLEGNFTPRGYRPQRANLEPRNEAMSLSLLKLAVVIIASFFFLNNFIRFVKLHLFDRLCKKSNVWLTTLILTFEFGCYSCTKGINISDFKSNATLKTIQLKLAYTK